MAHDIDQSTGQPAMAYTGEKPWHGLGEKLAAGQTIETWLKAARLDWELKRLPVQYLANGTHRTMEEKFVLARSDTHEALSIVSSDYKIVQPGEVLEFYRDLMEECGYTLETAGALDSGRKVWALAKTGITAEVDPEPKDEIAAYVLLATSCDKTLATTAAFTSIRVVCTNTLFFALDDVQRERRLQVKVPHNRHFDADRVKKELGLINPAWKAFLAKVCKMVKHQMSTKEASEFFRSLLAPKKEEPLSWKAERERQTMTGLFESAPGQNLATAKGTLWGAVNAVTYYTDHVRFGAKDRLDAAWFGTGYTLKEKAWSQADSLIS